MLKKIIAALRGRTTPVAAPVATHTAPRGWEDDFDFEAAERNAKASRGDIDWIREAVFDESNEAFKAIEVHPYSDLRGYCLQCLTDGIAYGGQWIGDREKALIRLSELSDLHRSLAFNEYEKEREKHEQKLVEYELQLVTLPFMEGYVRTLLTNQTFFSKEEWLARAAEGKRYRHSDDVFLGVPDEVLDEAKADFEKVRDMHSQIVRFNGPYMITVTADGATVLKDVLAGNGGSDLRETFDPVTSADRTYSSSLH